MSTLHSFTRRFCSARSEFHAYGRCQFPAWIIAAGVLIPALLGGCSKTSSPVSTTEPTEPSNVTAAVSTAAGIATIDVSEIARLSGKLSEINAKIDKRESELNLMLEGLRQIHLEKVADLEKKFGNEMTEEQKKELQILRTGQASEYNRSWQETRLKLSALKQKLDQAFLATVQPIAKQVARDQGLSVVIRKENVFCLVDQFDITEDVTAAFLKEFPKPDSAKTDVKVAALPGHGGSFEPLQK